MGRLFRVIWLFGFLVAGAAPLLGQSVQAVQNVRDAVDDIDAVSRDSTLVLAVQRLTSYRIILVLSARSPGEPAARFREGLRTVIRALEDVVDSRHDPSRFVQRVKTFNEIERRFLTPEMERAIAGTIAGAGATTDEALGQIVGTLGLPLPQAHKVVPGIVFTTGPEVAFGSGKSVISIGLSTNLVGEAVGTTFDLLGSTALKDYFSKNVAAGTAIPLEGKNKLSAQIGLGLGGINLRDATLWPVLNIEQTDSADSRVPSGLIARKPTVQNWSSPIFSLGIVPYSKKGLEKRLAAGKLVVIPIAGIRLPYYYPNDPFSALVALFTNKRADFEKEGKVQFILGLSVPLLRVADLPPES